jgi:acetylornithine deacetylase/succinyl-diaminopimelate desuccinylase-like protein
VPAACSPYTLDRRDRDVAAACRACVPVFGRAPLLLPSGGSIPFVSDLAAITGVHSLLLGFGLAEDGIHVPNERFALGRLHRGSDTCVRLYAELARI